MLNIQKEFTEFCKILEDRLQEIGLNLEMFPIDHVCYRVSSQEGYKEYRELFAKVSILYTKKYFHERDFHTFVLREPLTYKDIKINYLEFAQPGGSDNYNIGFQHLEFLTREKWENVVKQSILDKYLFKSKNGEEYIKWEDKIALKITATPQITHALLEDNSKIYLQ